MMMYCPKCNNTHWARIEPRNWMDQIAMLRLRRPYQCTKCERVRLGPLFLDHTPVGPRKSRRQADKVRAAALKCPHCGGVVRRSHRTWMERLLFIIKTYRCTDCRERFRKLSFG